MDHDEPQNPKPTTDGKQTAGHFNTTRSKVKRTSLSDNSSSGAQEQQPPLKKKMRIGAKQAGKSVKIRNNDPIQDSNADEPNTVDEYAPAKVALQNDLILESLWRYMNRSDLLRCRVVNKKWEYEATKVLQRRKLVIRFSFVGKGNGRRLVFRDICRCVRNCRTPSLLSSLQVKTNCWNDLGSAGVTSFFTTVGKQMKHLTLHLNYLGKKTCFKDSNLITHFKNLLFRQAPNLEFLEIKFDFPEAWKEEMPRTGLFYQNLQERSTVTVYRASEFLPLPNLKTFIVTGTPLATFFADVIDAAVNLRYVGGAWSSSQFITVYFKARVRDFFWGAFSSKCIKYFLGPEGRAVIHLLKSLTVHVADYFDDECDEWNDVNHELMETFLTEHKQNLQLETFECVAEFNDEEIFLAARTAYIISQILEYSSESLQKLKIGPAKWFKDLLATPRLPKLKEISFNCFWSSIEGPDGDGFLPRGFNMNYNFPNVSTIVLLRCTDFLFMEFVNLLGIELTEPVLSVRYIIIDLKMDANSILPLASDFHHIFPNLLSVSCIDEGEYCLI